ncbi:enoyl-CoA hydratase-related protein, partial [Litorivivens sp.]
MSNDAPVPHYETLILERSGRLLTITINRPELFNAVNLKLHEELAEVFTFATADAHSDVVVLTGAGKAFSAG